MVLNFGMRKVDCGRRKRLRPFIVLLLLLALSIVSISSGLRAEEKPTLAILPFYIERGGDPGKGVACPVCRGVHRSGETVSGSQNTLTRGIYGKMETVGTFIVLPLEKVEEAFSRSDLKRLETSPGSTSIQMGRELKADFVMLGILFRFEERVGSSFGVDKPASVAFDLHLFRLRDGVRVWDGKFDETQKPLFDNLLQTGSFIRRKAHWLTAAELAEVGMEEMLKKLPGVRELEEKP